MAGTSTGSPSYNSYSIEELGGTILNPPKPKTLSGAFGEAAKGEGMGLLQRFLYKAIGPWTIITDFIGDQIEGNRLEAEKQAKYLVGIQHLAGQKVPGFEYREIEINGKKVIVAVDASSSLGIPRDEPYVWTNADDPGNPALKAKMAEIGDKAKADIEAFRQSEKDNFPARKEAYRKEMTDYLERVANAETPEDVEKLQKPPPLSGPDEVLRQRITDENKALESKTPTGPDAPGVQWVEPVVGLTARVITRRAGSLAPSP